MRDKNKNKNLIKEILRFKQSVDKIDCSKLPNKLIGDLGEMYVIDKLFKLGYKNIEPKGGHSRYDIYLHDTDKSIEVRTSLLKNENVYPKGIDFYGWAVKRKTQKTDNEFDILIGIALSRSFKRPKYYIFTRAETGKLGTVKGGRFNNITKKIHIFNNETTLKRAIKAKPYQVTRYERYINRNPDKFLDRWDKLK
jgi:hypothetical protein